MKKFKKTLKEFNKGEYWSCNIEENTMRKQLQKIKLNDQLIEDIIDKAKEDKLVGVVNDTTIERAIRIYVSRKGLEYAVYGTNYEPIKLKFKDNGHINLTDEEINEVDMLINKNKFNI